MESLLETFSGAFRVTLQPNDPATPHPRFSEYKCKPSNVPDQRVRRQRMLNEQKKQRADMFNYARKIAEGDLTDDFEDMDTVDVEKKFNPYRNQLMLSEWLVEIPEDLQEEWLMIACPIGRRNFVIASKGSTAAYTKVVIVSIDSHLFYLEEIIEYSKLEYTILDCVFSEVDRTFYVLDVMCWRGHPVYDSETEFRFYWLHNKLEEQTGINSISNLNPFKFVGVESYPCKPETIEQVMSEPFSYQIDGLLLYHKRTHYVSGSTPLVGWLKPHMLPDVLGIPVPSHFLKKESPKRPEQSGQTAEKHQSIEEKHCTSDGEEDMEAEQGKKKSKKKSNEDDEERIKWRWSWVRQKLQ